MDRQIELIFYKSISKLSFLDASEVVNCEKCKIAPLNKGIFRELILK
jgi:hypothetical protein